MTQELLLCRWMRWTYQALEATPATVTDAAFALAVEATNRPDGDGE